MPAVELFAFAGVGFLLGFVSGLTPGLHVNSFALLLAAVAGSLTGVPTTALGVAMVSAAVTHTFLDIVPSVVLGVPDDSMALTALPGHRMVLDGDGREAIRISAAGSMLAVCFGLVLALPLTAAMVRLYPVLESQMAVVLGAVAVFLVATESRSVGYDALKKHFAAAFVLASSGLLGYYVLENSESATALVGEPSLLVPLFAGLFGVPLLVTSAVVSGGIPEQRRASTEMSRRSIATSALGGSVAGGVVGWIPGVSPAVATTLVQSLVPSSESEDESMRSFIVAVSGVNTSNALFALLALYFIRRSRSGVTVALSRLGRVSADELVVYVAAVTGVALLAFVATVRLADVSFAVVRRVNYAAVTASVVVLLVVLTLVFSGPFGLPVLVAGSIIGSVPNVTRVRRVHCMGSLLLPLIVYYA